MVNRIYCVDCQVFYNKTKTGVNVPLGNGQIIRGDVYVCPRCKTVTYGDFGEPFEVKIK